MGIIVYNNLPAYIKKEFTNPTKYIFGKEIPFWKFILFNGWILQFLYDEKIINEDSNRWNKYSSIECA